jgi:hypothetical protein
MKWLALAGLPRVLVESDAKAAQCRKKSAVPMRQLPGRLQISDKKYLLP